MAVVSERNKNQNKSQYKSIKWLNSSENAKINNAMSLSLSKNVKLGFLRIAKISKRNKKDVHKEIVIIAIEQYTKNLCHLCKM